MREIALQLCLEAVQHLNQQGGADSVTRTGGKKEEEGEKMGEEGNAHMFSDETQLWKKSTAGANRWRLQARRLPSKGDYMLPSIGDYS